MPQLIRTTPVLVWDAGESHQIKASPFTIPSDRTLTQYGVFTATVRIDPLPVRTGADRVALESGQVDVSSWAVAATGTFTPATNGDTVLIPITVPSTPGVNRYVVDVVAVGEAYGQVQILPMTYLTVRPS